MTVPVPTEPGVASPSGRTGRRGREGVAQQGTVLGRLALPRVVPELLPADTAPGAVGLEQVVDAPQRGDEDADRATSFGAHAARLDAVARRHDPHGVFADAIDRP
jgi:hypothetical protein